MHRVHRSRLGPLIKRASFTRLIFREIPLEARFIVSFFRDFLADILLFCSGTVAQVRKNLLTDGTTLGTQPLPFSAFLRT